MARIHRIGQPENESESLAIRTLAEVLPEHYLLFHNFEITTGRGLPYEYDIVVVADHVIWHVEVKGYRGAIRGDRHSWVFTNGHVQPSPIPLANKKSRILASKLKRVPALQQQVYVDTTILLASCKVPPRLNDDQASRVILLKDAADHLTDRRHVPVKTEDLSPVRDIICKSLHDGTRAGERIKAVGLYDVCERINQTDTRTVFLAEHRHIATRPKTILKLFHFDVYADPEEREREISAIFHDQDAMRVLGTHPNLIRTGDMFAWADNQFVLPTEYIENAQPLLGLLDGEARGEQEIPWRDRIDWIAKIARGLRHAHANGVIHRDVQPLNVVVAPDGVCKLVNFDLALIKDSPHLGEIRIPQLRDRFDRQYVAPEVWRDPKAADARSDIYSLGILIYRLIAGCCPYDDIEKRVRSKEPTPIDGALLEERLSCRSPDEIPVPAEELIEVIERMTQRAPKHRYSTMDAVIEALQATQARE